jgi:aspartokinase/homoserine dehydrogenase 1
MITAALVGRGTEAKWVDSREIVKTNSEFGNATVDYTVTNENIQSLVKTADKLFIIPGFVASDAKNITTTLGRGGSDFTAAIFAAAVNAGSLEIWTDVSGMMTADPDGWRMQRSFPPFRTRKRWSFLISAQKLFIRQQSNLS